MATIYKCDKCGAQFSSGADLILIKALDQASRVTFKADWCRNCFDCAFVRFYSECTDGDYALMEYCND